MIPQEVLDRAVARGLVTRDQALALADLAREAEPGVGPGVEPALGPAEDEALRLVTGFADIFVTIGLGLFLVPLGMLLGASSPTLGAAGIASAALALAEFFTRRRRMALPSIALLAAFAAACFWSVLSALDGRLSMASPLPAAAAALFTAGAVALHYRRYRVPITVASGAAALAVAGVALLAAVVPGLLERHAALVALACGLAIFALAMRFDLSDPERRTRATDVAFWLHLLAAPLVVHSTLGTLVSGAGSRMTAPSAALILAAFLALGFVAIAIDRRALLVAGLSYAGYALARLVFGAGQASALPVAFLLGTFVLLLSAGWRPLRARVLARLPGGLAGRLPRPAGL